MGKSHKAIQEISRGWNKVNLFSEDMPPGYILYMDLDIVIINNFDDEILAVLDAGHEMNCVQTPLTGWREVQLLHDAFKSGSKNTSSKIFSMPAMT